MGNKETGNEETGKSGHIPMAKRETELMASTIPSTIQRFRRDDITVVLTRVQLCKSSQARLASSSHSIDTYFSIYGTKTESEKISQIRTIHLKSSTNSLTRIELINIT